MKSSRFSIKEVFRNAWVTYRTHFVYLSGNALAGVVLMGIIDTASTTAMKQGILFLWLIFLIGGMLVQLVFMIYMTMLSLQAVRGEELSMRRALESCSMLPKVLGGNVVYMFICLGGLILLVVPGIIWAVKYGLWYINMLDEKGKMWDSFRTSAALTKGSRWKLFFFSMILTLISFVGALFFGIGVIITIPITLLAMIYVYLALKRTIEPVVITVPTEIEKAVA